MVQVKFKLQITSSIEPDIGDISLSLAPRPFVACSMKFCPNFVLQGTNVQRPGHEATSPWERGGVIAIPLVEGQGRPEACFPEL